MFYPDLTPYTYQAGVGALNVGWLARHKPYPKGIVSDEFLVKLKALVKKPINLMRGSHKCEFCDHNISRGNGELHIAYEGITYAAPVLIAHYVEAHYYKPPDKFIRAVLGASI
jgi:hypothetical protein